ncbi:MAG: DnaJ domain-containing protein [Bacteroidota bacterium]
MNEFKDYYKVLSISRESTPEEIKTAYRDLALQFHPDQNDAPEAHSRFLEISEAYQILNQPAARSKYNIRYDKYHQLGTQKNTANEGYAHLERVRRKRASRYGRSMYTQRMRYRGGTFSPSASDREPRERTYTQSYQEAYASEAAAKAEYAVQNSESTLRGFRYFALIQRVIIIGIFIFAVGMVLDKYTAQKTAAETVALHKLMPWSFSTPGMIRIITDKSSFGVEKTEAPFFFKGDKIHLKKSPIGHIPVKVLVIKDGKEQELNVYGTLYAPPFYMIWLLIGLCVLTFFTTRNPEYNVYIGLLTLFVTAILTGVLFFS